MRAAAITLALLFLTGTQARYLWMNEEPQSPDDRFKEYMDQYLEKIREIGKAELTKLESTEAVKQLNLQLAQKFDDLSSNVLNLREQLQPYVKNFREQVVKELVGDISAENAEAASLLGQLYQRWKGHVAGYQEKANSLGQELQQQAKENLDSFSQKVQPLLEEFRDKLRIEADTVRAKLIPYVDDMRQKTVKQQEQLREKVGSWVQEYGEHLSKSIEKLGSLLQGWKEQVPHAEELQSKLTTLMEFLRTRLAPTV
ncbi:apolipoprotein A-I [Rhinatrema bivittatum]|uniref:apolipoprotein A-I n=1 Tax=Rhinatrema bivittatum TaxID=194408 RepID=UPI00112E57B4|nr:apolipoprotein A-I [Rhinatrema bivittatum]